MLKFCRYIVGIAGVPGSGKSSTAFGVAQGINELASAQRGGAAIVVQMDGTPAWLLECKWQVKHIEGSCLFVYVYGWGGQSLHRAHTYDN